MADPSDISQEPPPSDPALAFAPIEQAPTPAPTPVTGPQILIEEQAEPTPIDDETAWRYVETTGPDTAPAELDIRKREMAGYYAAKQEEDRQREAIYYEDAYTNEKKRREILDRPEVAQARIGAKDPKLVETAAINNAYLEYLIGRKLDPSELEAQRHEMGRRMFGDPSMSHDSFAAAVKGQFEHKQQERVGLTDLRANVFDDVWNNKYTTGGDTFMRWRDAHDDILNDQNEKPFYWYSRKQAETFYKAADRIKEPGSLVLDAVQTYLAGPGGDPQHEQKLNQKFVAAGEAMLALDPKDRALVWQGVKYVTDSKKVEAGVVETIIDNIQKAFVERGIVGAATDVNMQGQDMKLEDTRQYLLGKDVRVRNSDGLPAVMDPSTMPLGSAERETAERYLATQTHPATPEETSDLLRKANTAMGALQMLREGKNILQTQIDPYRPVTPDIWWMRKTEMGAYNLIESAPTMVLNAVPIVGQSLMALSFASHDYNEMMLRDPGMDKRIASAGSIVSGQVQAVLEHFQIESMLGKSQLKRMLGDLRAGNFQTVARNFGILFAEQNLQEAAQDFTSMFVPWLASQFTGAEMKPRDFGVEFGQFLEQRVDVAFALLIPTLVGTGVASWTDLKNPARDLFDERMMNNAGFSPEARARILGKATLEERIAAYQEEWKKRTPEEIAAGYASTAAEIDRVNGQQTDPATPTMENRPLADGTADWHVLDAEGNTVFHSKDYDIALDQYALHAERTLSERIAAQEAAAATEEGQATAAEAEGALRVLTPEARTSASVVLDFVRNEQPRPEQSAAVARLATTLAKDPRGGPTDLVIQLPVVGGATRSGRAALDYIQGWERLTGKQVIFVASSSGQPLSFTGIVNPSDPNTIFLDAAGDRNVLALLGHEWAHTLALTNPQLHRAMTQAMRPFVIGWLEQEGLLKEKGYGEGQVTEELVSNIVGDAFTRPEFWAEFHRRNPSLFERIIQAIQDWFASITAAARGSEWATEGFISQLEELHGVIMSAIEQARTAGPEVTVNPPSAELMMATRRMAEKPAFKKWFGESKVVDQNGDPLIVYHGTNADFDIFKKGDIGFHFGTIQAANDRLAAAHEMIEDWRVRGHGHPGYNILPVYLRIEKPARLPDLGSWHYLTVAQELRDADIFAQTDLNYVQSNNDVIKLLVDKGYDGIVYRNVGEGRRKLTPEEIKAREIEVRRMYPESTGPLADTSIAVYDKTTDTLLSIGSTEKEARELARDALETKTHAFDDSYIIFRPEQAKSAIGNIGTFDIGRPELTFATRRGKAAQAQAEGISREESVAAAFERMHAAPGERLALLERIKREYTRIRAQNVAAEAAAPAPQQIDPTAELDRLEAQETKALEDIDVEEQAALDASSQQIADRYADRILAEQDIDARRALERESKNVAATQRKGIEKQFNERRKAIESDFRRQQQTVTLQAEQANLAATKEGAAQLSEMRRVHAFAELNALTKALPPAIRGRIGGAMTLAQARTTEASLTDFLTKRIAMIDRELERALQHAYVERIKDLLDRFKLKKAPSGVLKSRIGDAQDTVNAVRDIIKMDNDQVAIETARLETALTQPGLDPDEESGLLYRQHLVQSFGDFEHHTSAQLAAAHEELRATIDAGRAAFAVQEEARLAKQRSQSDEIVAGYPGATPAGVKAKEREGFVRSKLTTLKGWIVSIFNFGQFMKEVLPDSVTFVDDWTERARKADGASQDFIYAGSERFAKALRQAIGSKSALKVGDAIRKMQEPTVAGKDGPASQLEAIQYLLSWAQADVRTKMESQGWTQAHMDVLADATQDPVSQAVMRFLGAEYEQMWNELNPTYKAMYGSNMPRLESYAPTRYWNTGAEQEINPFGGPTATSGVTASFLKARVKHSVPLRQTDAMAVYMQHMVQASHFIHYTQLIREVRGTLNRSDVKMAMAQQLGADQMDLMTRWIDALARNGSNKANETRLVTNFLRTVISGKAIGSLILNPRTIAMQADSALRFMNEIPAGSWMPTLLNGKFWTSIAPAWHSETIQRRVNEGMSPESKYIMEQSNLTSSRLLQGVRLGMWPLRIADAAFTSISSAAVFTYNFNQFKKLGFSEQEATAAATDAMDRAVHKFSQPTGLTSKSIMEVNQAGTMKIFTLFMADPRLKSAIMLEAALGLSRGQNIKQNLRRIATTWIMAAVSQTMANLYRDWATEDDDDEIWTWQGYLRAMLLAPIQGVFLVGSVADSTLAWMLGEQVYVRPSDPLTEAMQRAQRSWKNLDDLYDGSPKEMIREWDNILKTAGVFYPPLATGAALTNVAKAVEGATANLKKQED